MLVQRAYKTELDLNDRQATACRQHAGAARWAYNWGLRVKQERYRATNKSPTASKRCSGCRWLDEELTLSTRTFHCQHCGLVLNSDLNAAINLERLAGSSSESLNACGAASSGTKRTPRVKLAAKKQEPNVRSGLVQSWIRLGERQHLLIDGDDTLWENNIYFEEAITAFVTFLAHSTLSTEEIRQVLDEAERHAGYGSANFARSLEYTYRRLVEREVTPEDIERVHQLATEIRQHPLEIMPGVSQTLAYLAPRHDLVLVTKGDLDEQRLKIEASGLEPHFQKTIIVGEKDPDTYRKVLSDLGFPPRQSWMIGNSPRSDINPALEVGMNAVLVPHPHTWRLEHQEVQLPDRGQTFITIPTFADLRHRF